MFLGRKVCFVSVFRGRRYVLCGEEIRIFGDGRCIDGRFVFYWRKTQFVQDPYFTDLGKICIFC